MLLIRRDFAPLEARMAALRRKLRHTGRYGPPCAICNEPVKLETAKADGEGRAVHEECYVEKHCLQKADGAARP